jgi:hypothetical protein
MPNRNPDISISINISGRCDCRDCGTPTIEAMKVGVGTDVDDLAGVASYFRNYPGYAEFISLS